MADNDSGDPLSLDDEMALLKLRWENLQAMFAPSTGTAAVEAYRFACHNGASWVVAVQMAYHSWSRLAELLQSLTENAVRERSVDLAAWRAQLAKNEAELRALIARDRTAVGTFEEIVAKALIDSGESG